MPDTKQQPATNEELIELAREQFGWTLPLPEIQRMIEDARDFPDFLPMKADKRTGKN